MRIGLGLPPLGMSMDMCSDIVQQAKAAISEKMVEELYIFGTPEECRTQLAAFTQGGVTLPIVAAPPSSRLTPDDLSALVDAFGN